nr:CFF_HP1_G0049400.mRNA.1.CDS.1 [Saccharomyces cerevisiae]
MNEEYKEYWKTSSLILGTLVGDLKFLALKRRDLLSDTEKSCLVPGHARRRETISVLDSTRGKQGSQVFPHVWKADQRVVL